MKCAIAASALLLTQAVPAAAEQGTVDQIEKLDIERGETELELQFIHIVPREHDEDEDDDESAQRQGLGATLEYGFSDRFQLGVELNFARAAGEALKLGEVGLQFKWIALEESETAPGLGLQSAAVIDPDSGNIGSETFLIAQKSLGEVDAVANIIVETEPGDWSRANLSYGFRLDRPVLERLALGIEAGGGLSGEGEGSHFIGAVAETAPWGEEGPGIELSLFAPLSDKAPALQVRLELDWNF